MVIMAVDIGGVRTGLAVCDAGERLASPAGVLVEHNRERLAERIAHEAEAHGVQQFVVGLPRNMDGSEGSAAKAAREFAALLGARTGLPCVLQDERGTTVTAHRYLSAAGVRGKKRKAVTDAVAAVIILQDYLDAKPG